MTPLLQLKDEILRENLTSVATPKSIALFGATGTIGDNTLDIVRQHPDKFRVSILTAFRNAQKLVELALEFEPELVVVADEQHYKMVRETLPAYIEVMGGHQSLVEAASCPYDCMVSAMMGFAALKPTLTALRLGRNVALANKECLVAAGQLFMEECRKHRATLLPVDSEHNGLFQLWHALNGQQPIKVTLTASGGPFRGWSLAAMHEVTPEQAVAHPNWNMGAKISVDSATLMNKGLELIEAQHLFDLDVSQLDVLVHPQSIMHCLISFADGSSLAQLGLPDMRTPLAYAMHYPQRLELNLPPLSLAELGTLTFERAQMQHFPCLALAFEAMRQGGGLPTVLNAANEVAVEAFLHGRIRFTDIPMMIEKTLEHIGQLSITTLDDVFEIDHSTRLKTQEFLV